MVSVPAARLPLHDFMAELIAWQADRSAEHRRALDAAFERLLAAYGANGAHVVADLPPLEALSLGAGTLRGLTPSPGEGDIAARRLEAGDGTGSATLWIDARDPAARSDSLAEAIEMALTATWSQAATVAQRRQLEALDGAARSIASISSVDRVLQLIVDRVRDLVGAKYAALGTVGQFGRIEQFIVSGITSEQRALLGMPPQGHGLLGLIIREDRALLVDDIATHPGRYGFPAHHPPMHSLLGVPVRSKGHTIGNFYLTDKIGAPRFTEEDLVLVEKFALHAGIAIENARLHEEIGRLAIIEERQRISQDLHDSIIQSLYAISLSLEDLPEVITEDPAEGAVRADRAIDSIHATIRDIRNFIMGLQPELLEQADLPTGLSQLGAEFRANTLIDLEVHMAEQLPALGHETATHLLAITREALSNIARHSSATRASLELAIQDANLVMVIGDNGRGFDATLVRNARQRGLANLRSRAEAIGGELKFNSEPGAGTRLELSVPLEAIGRIAQREAPRTHEHGSVG